MGVDASPDKEIHMNRLPLFAVAAFLAGPLTVSAGQEPLLRDGDRIVLDGIVDGLVAGQTIVTDEVDTVVGLARSLRVTIEHAANDGAVGINRLDEEHGKHLGTAIAGAQSDGKLLCRLDRYFRIGPIEFAARLKAMAFQTFDDQGGRRVDRDGAQDQKIAFREANDIGHLAHGLFRRPDEAITLDRGKGAVGDGAGRRVGRVRRDISAAGGAVRITPAMILAFQLATVVDAYGKPDPAMQAAVFPDVDETVIGAPDGEFPAHQLAMEDMAVRQVGSGGDRMPPVSGFFQHASLSQIFRQAAAGMTP
jgi:hypothetical protein